MHICHKWRRIVFASQRVLQLRLFCTHGTHVQKTLDCWPAALSIVVEYGGSLELDPPAPEDEDHVMAALKQCDRVHSISLTVTRSLLEKLSTIKMPLSELEDLVLLSRDSPRLTLPSAFGWGTRLRRLHLTRIAFSALPLLLYSSRSLLDLQLHEVPNPWLSSPEVLTDALSGMAQLRSLSLRFLPTTDHIIVSLPSWKRVVFPALTRFDFRGTTKYLEDLVARIDAPRLGDIEVAFFNESSSDLSKLSEFIDRIEMHKSHSRADILCSEGTISISLIQPGGPTRLKFQSFCKPLASQLSSLSRICIHSSALLFAVKDLRISATRQSKVEDSERWPELINSFTGIKCLHISGNISIDIMRALQLPDKQDQNVIPALQKLYIPQPGPRHAPLREMVVSFMISRRLSGHPVEVEYERLCHMGELRGTGTTYAPVLPSLFANSFVACTFSQQVTIETLSDDILLNIFRHNLDETPRFWPTLAWVCRRWRQIILTSPLGLNLRLHCSHGTPVLKALTCWPALPIIVKYGGVPNLNPPAPEDDDNIIAALKQSDRVSFISLTVTSSLLGKFSVISEPLSELEELALLSQDKMQLTLPSTFRWGPRLRILHSTRIAFPSFPQLLLPSQDLVDIKLDEIPIAGYFSPEAFANALSGIIQLRTLSLHFLSLPPRRKYLALPPPPGERIILLALTHLKYRGSSKYLDSLVARIDAPHLEDFNITFFNQPTMDASQLGRFIERTEMVTSLGQAEFQISMHAISISFTNPSASTPLRLRIPCKQLDWQLSSMAQICDRFSSFLFRVKTLSINTNQSESGPVDVNMRGGQGLELFRSFHGTRNLLVVGELTTDLLCALRPTDESHTTNTIVLPALRHLRVQNPIPSIDEPFWDITQSLIDSRRLSVELDLLCHICKTRFTEQEELRRHLVLTHEYQMVCSYCGNFQCKLGYTQLFREHLNSSHPEEVRNDALILDPRSAATYYQLQSIAFRHGSPRMPDIATPSTTTPDDLIAWLGDIPPYRLRDGPRWSGGRSPALGSEGGSAGNGEVKKDEEDFDPAVLSDVATWLRTLRLHKYTPNFEGMTWKEMVVMDEQALEAKGVAALGARRKMLKTFEVVRRKMGIDDPTAPPPPPPPPPGGSTGNSGAKKDEEDFDLAVLNDVAGWLRTLRLYKYAPNFESMTWKEMVVMDEQALEWQGVAALGARRKMLKAFEVVRRKMDIDDPTVPPPPPSGGPVKAIGNSGAERGWSRGSDGRREREML